MDNNMRNDFYNFINELNMELNNIFKEPQTKSFPVDVVEADNGFVVFAEMPGVKKENINVTFEDGKLTIEGKKENVENTDKYLINERSNIPYKRVISFGDILDDQITAKLEDGILKVTITTKEPEKTSKSIIIE